EEYRGNLDGAIAAYEKVARPERPHITLHLGNLLLRRGAYEEAEEYFRSLLSRHPDHPAAQRGEALAAFGKAHDGRAYWLIRKVFAANPDDALACYILGTLEIERGEKAQGISTLARCLSIESKEAIDFDFIFRDVRNRKEVYAALVEAGGKAAQPGKALLTVAQILSDQEETDSALGIYDELLRKLPDNPALHTLRGNLLLRSHRLDEARRAYERALELDPTFAWALRGLGWTAFQAHDFKKAEEAFRKALEIKNDPVAWNGLGEALRSQGRYEEARRAYLQAIGEAPDFRPPYLNLARMNREEGYFVEAIETYQAYLDRYPGDREARFQLGLAYFYAQRHREAARTWQALLEVEHPREDYLEIFTYFALQYSGDSEAADRLIRKKLEKLNHSDWPASVFAFLGRRISEEELVAAARDADERKTLENLCEAYYYLGAWYRSVRQDPKTARRYFELAVETKVTDFIEYRLARIALGLEGE
ncbi:MAG: tetratricopeptide repeat protein, partial [Deltaproteobacteria bacterium]